MYKLRNRWLTDYDDNSKHKQTTVENGNTSFAVFWKYSYGPDDHNITLYQYL